MPVSADVEDIYEPQQEVKLVDTGRRVTEKETLSYLPAADYDKQRPSFSSGFSGRQESGVSSGSMDRERFEINNAYGGSTSQKLHSYSQNSLDTEEKVQKVSPPRRKGSRDTEKSEKLGSWLKKDSSGSESSTINSRQQSTSNYNMNNVGSQPEPQPQPPSDGNINALLEVGGYQANNAHCL